MQENDDYVIKHLHIINIIWYFHCLTLPVDHIVIHEEWVVLVNVNLVAILKHRSHQTPFDHFAVQYLHFRCIPYQYDVFILSILTRHYHISIAEQMSHSMFVLIEQTYMFRLDRLYYHLIVASVNKWTIIQNKPIYRTELVVHEYVLSIDIMVHITLILLVLLF